MSGSVINISSTDMFTSNTTSIFECFPFQSKQWKAELLRPYGNYFEEFKLNTSPWEITELEKKEKKESKNQEFTYQNPITENSEFRTPNLQTQQNSNLENPEIKTPNIQPPSNQNNQNSNLINQPDLSPIIVINPPPVEPIGQPLQQSHQQIQQLLVPLQQLPQHNLDPMVYALIAKLEKFTSKEDNAQVWLNNVEKAIAVNGWNDARAMQAIPYFLQNTANLWYQSLINKSQDFNAFKIKFLRYFSNNNSINKLANIFTTIKQGENEAVTTYLECFHRNLHQIQAIDPNYFTVAQILNQFICGLHSSILQHVCPMHPINLQAAITNARDFEATELEANHVQAVNLVMNKLSKLDSKLKQFTIPSELLIYDTAATLSTTSILNANLSTDDTSNLSATTTTHLSAAAPGNVLAPTNSNTATELTAKWNPKVEIDPTKLEIVDEDTQSNNPETNQHPTLISNILPATITKNKLLDAIFLFEPKKPSIMSLFSGAALEENPITVMYTDTKVNGHTIKLILNSGSAGSIIT
ncbi:hypothetical protein G9A89_011683 [Geosiphon pyriformis]|nr:hypothetical protein G9A89_011683 [Geosiphon pyriformis]